MTKAAQGSLLYLDAVSVAFDGFKAINKLSLILEPGEMRAIIGPNGAGKTTMMDIVTGKTRPDSGDVIFDGQVDLIEDDQLSFRRANALAQALGADELRRIPREHARTRAEELKRRLAESPPAAREEPES